MTNHGVIVVGAGLAGLCCALELRAAGRACLVVEADDAVGGRVRTDDCAGFRLDRGFQVLLTAYPEVGRVLDARALELRAFTSGALVRTGGRGVRLLDPTRHPLRGLGGLLAPVGSLRDKLRVLRLRRRSRAGTLEELFGRPETSTLEALRATGFSESMIDVFFRPWLGGVFLDRSLGTSSRMLEFVVRMFAEGDAALPAGGMGRIPAQLAARLGDEHVRTNAPVARVAPDHVELGSGETLAADAVVVATEGKAAARLLGREDALGSHAVTCLYFAAEKDPVGEPLLVLDGDGAGPVNNLAVPSAVAPGYAPPGAALVAASVLGLPDASAHELEGAVRRQLAGWFGSQVGGWRHLRTYRIEHALPAVSPSPRAVRAGRGLYVCGDHRESPSIQGAMASGRRCAQAVLADADAEGRAGA